MRIPGPRTVTTCALAIAAISAPSASAATNARVERIAGYESPRS